MIRVSCLNAQKQDAHLDRAFALFLEKTKAAK